jgi:NADP-dependent 3-hydroxy acid dehydrogenase YdfG
MNLDNIMMNIKSKEVIFLLGATGGIGKLLAEELKKNGYIIVGNGRKENTLKDMKNEGKIDDYIVGDLTKDEDRKKIIEKIKEYVNKGYKVSVFYNIGILYDYRGDISKYSIEEIRKAWETNVESIIATDIELLTNNLILDTIYMVSISAYYVGGWDHIYQITKASLDRYVAALIYDDKVNNRERRLIELSPDTIKTGEEGMGSKLKEYPKIPGEIFAKKVVEIINGKYKEYSGFIFEISEYKGIIAKLLNNKYISKLLNLFGIDLRPTIKLYGMNPSKDRNIFDYHEKKLLEKLGKAVY